MQAIDLFKSTTVTDELVSAINVRVNDNGSATMGLLPSTAKDGGASLKSISGLKGQALKAYRRRMADGLKSAMAKEFAARTATTEWTGRKVTVTATGAIGFFIEPCESAPVDAAAVKANAKLLTDDDLLALISERKLTVPAPAAPAAN